MNEDIRIAYQSVDEGGKQEHLDDFVNGLRELADFYEAHPYLPFNSITVSVYEAPYGFSTEDMLEKLELWGRAMKPAEKFSNSYEYGLRKVFATYPGWREPYPMISLKVAFSHESVCEQVELEETEEVEVFEPNEQQQAAIDAAFEAYELAKKAATTKVVKNKTAWECPKVLKATGDK